MYCIIWSFFAPAIHGEGPWNKAGIIKETRTRGGVGEGRKTRRGVVMKKEGLNAQVQIHRAPMGSGERKD